VLNPHDVGIIGLAVMGRNLARNFARRGLTVAVYNRTYERTSALLAEMQGSVGPERGGVTGVRRLEDLVAALRRPRRLLIMVKAGAAVDDVLARLTPLLEPGDIVIDGGNSSFHDTDRRLTATAPSGATFVGMGVSGGAAGALHGPSLMPGGPKGTYRSLARLLARSAAVADSGPCITHCGRGSAGHFVKMIHNGIEYADMQLIAEAHDLLRLGLGLPAAAIGDIFAEWNAGELPSYLMGISADIVRTPDDLGGRGRLLDQVDDVTGRTGSGRMVPRAALELGIAVPTITAAVDARLLASLPDLRQHLARRFAPAPRPSRQRRGATRAIGEAVLASKICAYAQGFHLLAEASDVLGYGTDLAEVARIWKAGCIIRSEFLDDVRTALTRAPGSTHLLQDVTFGRTIRDCLGGWRATVQRAAAQGIALPAMSASLAYFDTVRRTHLPTNVIQAQRDLFGAHGYRRRDRRGRFSSSWSVESTTRRRQEGGTRHD